MNKYNKLVIGIDQSYKRTGISIVADGEIKKIKYIDFSKFKNNSEKRNYFRIKLNEIFSKIVCQSEKKIVIIERIRLRSDGFLNIDYIKSMGALNSIIIDTCHDFNLKCFSVDTRAWKSSVVGTSKPKQNKYYVDPKKWPTIQFVISQGFENDILVQLPENSRVKKYFVKNGNRCLYNDDAADSCGIALFGFTPKCFSKLKEEK